MSSVFAEHFLNDVEGCGETVCVRLRVRSTGFRGLKSDRKFRSQRIGDAGENKQRWVGLVTLDLRKVGSIDLCCESEAFL